MRGRDYEAHRAFSDSAHELERLRAEATRKLSPGCSSDCEWGQPCTCGHSKEWRAPRQPRRPEPRRPHLPLRTRFALWRDRPRLTNRDMLAALRRMPATERRKVVAFVAAVAAAGLAVGWLVAELLVMP